ncbi:MAG: hypothetical protein ACQGVC_24775 [Myxococcota bacterium]
MSGRPSAFYLADLREAVVLAQRLHQYRRGLLNPRPQLLVTRRSGSGLPTEAGFAWVGERRAAQLKDWMPEVPRWMKARVRADLATPPSGPARGAAS